MDDPSKTILIVGSGVGGLMCGAILSMEGYKVTVLERNKQLGGTLQSFARDKHLFDSGVHYLGGLEPGQNLYKVFKYLGLMDKVKVQKLDPDAFDKIIFHDDPKVYRYAQGYDHFIETMAADFPEERQAIVKYCDAIREICAAFPLYNLRMGDHFDKNPYLEIDTKGFIASITDNKKLQNVLGGNNGLYAGVGNKTPLYVHALVLNSYIESSYRIVDGGGQIAKFLSRIIRTHGGLLKTRMDVKRIVSEGKEVKYVECADGERYTADLYISNVHPAQTLEMLESTAIKPAYRHRIAGLENSLSAFMLNITLKPDTLRYERSNYYCFLNDDVWNTMEYTEENWPLSYSIFYSGTSKQSEYAQGISILAYMSYEEVAQWSDTLNTVKDPIDRGNGYEEFKQRKAEKLLEKVYERFPELKDGIKSYYSATPLTFRDYMGTADGALYGIAKDYRDPLRTFISPRTKLDNLLLAGQNINMHGILGVAISSLVTCSVLTGMELLLKKIDDAQTV